MKRYLTAIVLTLALGVGACGGDTATVELIDAPEAQALLAAPPESLVILDVRTPEEHAEAHIAGSSNIDFYEADFAAQLDQLDKDTPYFVYCRSGNRSAETIDTMRELGFSEVYELDGGILSWAGAGLPIE
jgi:rhodanese-related sulfurtransferase